MQYIYTKSDLARRSDAELTALRTSFEQALARTVPYSPDHRALAAAIQDVRAILNARRP